MEILTNRGFRRFEGIGKKESDCIRIEYVDDSGKEMALEGSCDHRVKVEKDGGKWERLDALDVGDLLLGDRGKYQIVNVQRTGKKAVYTPVGVVGGEYRSGGVDNHNCKFAGSSQTLIDGDVLDGMVAADPVEYRYGYDMNVYEAPAAGAMYVMGVDSAMGNAGDYSTVQVIRVLGREKYRQVATYSRNTIKAEDFAEVVHSISEWYNNALYVIENNDIGRTVADYLYYTIGDGNMLSTDTRGNLGTRADRNTKIDACNLLKTMVERGHLKIVDGPTIDQLARFEEVSPMVFRGSKGNHDDLVSSLYWAAYCLAQPEIDLDGMKVVEKKADTDAFPPPMYADFGQVSPFGAGIDADSFWAGLN